MSAIAEIIRENLQAAGSPAPDTDEPFRTFWDLLAAWKAVDAIPPAGLDQLQAEGGHHSIEEQMEQLIHQMAWKLRAVQAARMKRIKAKREVKGDVTRI